MKKDISKFVYVLLMCLVFGLNALLAQQSPQPNCAPNLTVKDTCMFGYARTWMEWNALDSGCAIQTIHRGTPYNTYSWNWSNQLDTNYMFINNYSPGDPFASSEGFWVVLEMNDSSFTDTIFANEFTCIEGCMDPFFDNYNPLANLPDVCLAIPPPQDDCEDSTNTSITIEFTPDTYASETSMRIVNQNDSSLLFLPQGFFSSTGSGNIYSQTICVPIDDTVQFIIYDSYGDGICGSCFGGIDGRVMITDECGDTIYSLTPGDNLNFGDADTSDLFVMKDCSWIPVVGCPNPGYLEFNPAADIMNPALCTTPRVIGCMDTTMFDFDPAANVPLMEDSCNYSLHLTDGGGDGWNGAYIVLSQLGNTYGPYTNISSSVEIINLNLKSNHPVTVRAYSQTSSDATIDQVGFKLINPEGNIILSGGTNPWNNRIKLFPDNYITLPNCPTICDPYVYGCMDFYAYNYDINANTSDGSCYYNPGCTDPQYLQYYTQGYTADYNDGSCETEAIWGCTDELAFNYNSAANLDNGGCIPVILGCMNDLAFNYNPNANTADTCIPVIEGCTSPIALNYDSIANTDDGSCVGVIYGCMDSDAFNYDPTANVDDGSCIDIIYGCMDATAFNYNPLANIDNGNCIPFVYGCTDSTMFNYNPLANADNNSCVPYIYGCTDPSMLNYDPAANTENFSCIPYVYGCMDSSAYNFDPTANTDNGSCISVVEGCMDVNAYNYNEQANVNDSVSCLYDAGCITGPGTPYWLNDPCYAWVIEVDEYCCENQWDTICQATYNYCEGTWAGPPLKRVIEKKLIMITDVLGRKSKTKNNKLLFYIYSDGTIEKKIKLR
tara:strand:- start:7271 stop:9775 length:2505 start_codon:yes stop_codon:yes gene_type:complete